MKLCRTKELFNFDWRFKLEDQEDAQLEAYDDSDWQALDLPHDYSIYGDFDQQVGGANGYRPQKVGWYRKHFTTTPELINAITHLEFEGVYMAPDIWLNGVHLGKCYNGYLDFQYNISDVLKPIGENNVLAIRVDNTSVYTSRWYTGSGIYRNVWLVRTNHLYVPRYGTYITTPKISDDQTKVHIETKITNATTSVKMTKLVTTITDSSMAVAGEATFVVPIAPGTTYTARQDIFISTPELWSTETPNLYLATSTISDEEGEQDKYETRFGIRDIEITPELGLLVNGKKVFCKGFNIHHDNGCLGAAAFDSAIKRRLDVMKELGCNAVRLSHNPHATKLLDYCDEMGILVFDEAYDKWDAQFNGEMIPFEETWRNDIKDWLERDRNHPSVFIWSAGNEVVKEQLEAEKEYGVPLLKKLVDFIHQHEPSRKVTAALYPAREKGIKYNDERYRDTEPAEMSFHMDVMSVNYMESFFEKDHKKYPQLSFILSEATTGMGGLSCDNNENRSEKISWFSFDHSHTVGIFYWGGIDYIGEAGKWPSKGWRRGFVDLAGWIKPIGYATKATFSDKPVVHSVITNISEEERIVWNDVELISSEVASHWNWEPDSTIKVMTFSNCESVELIQNGKSLGCREITEDDCMALTWDVPYESGELVAIGRNGGIEADKHVLRTAGSACRLQLISDKKLLSADGLDLAHITVIVTDAEGIEVPDANHKIHFEVEGAGTNAGVDNGDLMSDEFWQGDARSAYNGRALLVVRADRKAGDINITAEADGLETAQLTIQAQS